MRIARMARHAGIEAGDTTRVVWDPAAEAYDVDLSDANPPHLIGGLAIAVSNPAPARPIAGDRAQLVQNPKWRGTEAGGYQSRFGWQLDFIAERPHGLKRGERGKHWRLTLDGVDGEAFYRSKREATAAILAGEALAQLEGRAP